MTYREAPLDRDLSEPEAYAKASESVGFRLERAAVDYTWGWVYYPQMPAPPGPGPVSVTLRGVVISHGSLPYPFRDDEEPVDRFTAYQQQIPWWCRIFSQWTRRIPR
jgi:hypothetical protein